MVEPSEAAGAGLPVLPLEVLHRDQQRRKRAREILAETLESYFATLTRTKEIEASRLAEFIGSYACEIYDSMAEAYSSIPGVNPEVLFGIAGPLHGGLTLANVETCLNSLRVRRPWKVLKDPVIQGLDNGMESMRPHYEEPWLRREVSDIVQKRASETRNAFPTSSPRKPELRAPEVSNHRVAIVEGASVPDEFWRNLKADFFKLRREWPLISNAFHWGEGLPDEMKDPDRIGNRGALVAITMAPTEWMLTHYEGRIPPAGYTRRFEWLAESAAARLGFIGTGPVAVSFWLERIASDVPDAIKPVSEGSERMCLADVCYWSAHYCDRCFALEVSRPSSLVPSRVEDVPAGQSNRAGTRESSGDESTRTEAGPVNAANPAKSDGEGRKRGRPQEISDELKAQAQARKDSGGTNRDAAAIIYQTTRPTPQEVKNVSSILREHKKKSKQAAPSIQSAPKRTRIRG